MILRSFYARLSLLFLLLLLVLGGISLLIAFNASRHLFDEVEQLLNREYAGSIALELEPLVEDGFSKDGIKNAIHYMMVLNPMVEIYLLDSGGQILAYFTHPEEQLQRQQISTAPLEEFIDSQGWEPVQGDDPRDRSARKPFSAAPLPMGEENGYVYVILRGQGYDRSLALIGGNYYLRSGLITFLVAMLVTGSIGLLLFFLLTRRLRILSTAVLAFKQGEYDHRISIRGRDEIGTLGDAFNEMAESVEDAVNRLQEAEKQRSALIANISHDLRSPLTSIRGYLETVLLKDGNLSPEEQRDYLDITLKNVSSFQKLVEELFELARLEARQVSPQKEVFRLDELVQDVVLKRKPLSDRKNICIDYAPDGNISPIRGDIALLERVVTNVLENALEHTPENGRIEIRLKAGSETRILSIHDSGPGIADEDLPHVFERFYRADKSRNRNLPGTGLGLAIAREIVEIHGGRIEAASPHLGGAQFTITLPENGS